MEKKICYCTYKHYLAKFDSSTGTFTFIHTSTGAMAELRIDGLYFEGKKVITMDAYSACEVGHTFDMENAERKTSLTFIPKCAEHPTFQIFITATAKQIKMQVYELLQYEIRLHGKIQHGKANDCFAINAKDTATEAIHCAIGPAVARYNNAIYNKTTDSAFCVEGCRNLALNYNWKTNEYELLMQTMTEGIAEEIVFKLKENILANKYDIDFVPLKKRGKYTAPPAGWMTWYAVKFNASEEKVLENTRFQEKHLKDFGANTIWVDWEWCHKKYEKERFDGVDNFHPDPKKYPSGLGYVAEKIKKSGFIPALWLGFTNDPGLTDYEINHPEISLAHYETWSGKYYYDVTQPEYLNGFLPKAIQQVKDWGYEAIKFDTLPNCIYAHERFHQNMLNPDLTTFEAFRAMIQQTRNLLGEDFYMLACGSYISSILWSAGIFDASRIGPDLFTWEKFVYTVDRLRNYYPLHNIALINDPDNVVLREEYSTLPQARTRISIVSLLGLPVTFGDDLTTLPLDRVDLLKRALPVMQLHPTDFNNATCDKKTQVICQRIALPFEEYLVAGVSNLTEEEIIRDISFTETLRLHDGQYLVYDYFKKEFLGINSDRLQLTIKPYDTSILCIRKLEDHPQIISTSRHITQGAAELRDVKWGKNTLRISASLVKNDPYCITIHVPNGFSFNASNLGHANLERNILTISYIPAETAEYTFEISF